jgi:photosynthetic reaction center cytochrome c subunit
MTRLFLAGGALIATFALSLVVLLTFTRPPVDVIPTGYRGTGMQLIYNPHQVATALGINAAPAVLPVIDAGPPAGSVYKNVQVLKNVSSGAFGRLMVSMTTWVSPTQGCNYCHVAGNFASDAKYTKVVARRMLQMTIAVNKAYTNHVQNVGVTCYTCHRGNPVPSQIWFSAPPPGAASGVAESNTGKNLPAADINSSSLPGDPYTPFLLNNAGIRVSGNTALPTDNAHSIKQTEWTYALMMTYSQQLGVSCEFCHNSRAFDSWSESSPQRVTAFYAEAMLRDLNLNYMTPLTSVFPASRLGPQGDVAKINCGTCHQGVYKPLFGAAMAPQFAALEGVGTVPGPAPAGPPAMVPGTTPGQTTETPGAPPAASGGTAP